MIESRRSTGAHAAVTVAAALILAGCAGTHVGDDWQCPIAQGAVCSSVAAADPAVPETRGTDRLADDTPLYRPGDVRVPDTAANSAAESTCETGCNPLAWLARLFGADADGGRGRGNEPVASGRPEDGSAAGAADADAGAASRAVAGKDDGARDALLPATVVPGGDAPPSIADSGASPLPVHTALPVDELREPEVVGRVWIAPFVDADGIYREGAWVRLVIEPARWRLR